MANVSRARGFVPVRHLDGSPWNGQTQAFLIDSGNGTAVYVGDPVKIAGDSGTAGQVVAGMDVEGIPTAIRCASGAAEQLLVGVVTGFLVDPTNLALNYRTASTSRIALVCVDTTVVYEVQEDAATTPVAGASVGLLASFSTTAGSTTTGLSGIELISTSVATTNTLPLRILGLSKRVDNNLNTGGAGTDKAKFLVQFNTGAYMQNIAGG